MAKDINLYSREWCDIVFEGKNQDYGAYQVRLTSSRRHVISILAIVALTILVAFLPTIINKAKEAIEKARMSGFTEEIKMTQLEVEVELPEDFVPPELPPPPLIAQIKFTAPVITASEEMTDDDAIKSQEELTNTKAEVSIITYSGDDDPNAKSLIDVINEAKVITQEKEEEPHRFVDQMPEYPGGMEELYNLIRRKLVYPQQARDYNIQGTTLVEFVVSKDGKVDRVTVKVSSNPILDKEAVRVVSELPKWIPGKMNGKPVNCYYSIPIAFKLQ